MGKSWENHGKIRGKSWENHGKIIGKSWEMQEIPYKWTFIAGKHIDGDLMVDLMMVSPIYRVT